MINQLVKILNQQTFIKI